jgi:protein phosphatase
MATTMVAAVVRAGRLLVAHVGDSRAYLIRDSVATQLTRDHSLVGELIANGDMTEAEAQASRIKNKLTRSIGGEAEVHVDVHPSIQLQPGDRILLCSDGLTRYALREDIARLTAEGTPAEIVERLINFANKRGGADNVSAILISHEGKEALAPAVHSERPPVPADFDDTLDTLPEVQTRRRQPALPMLWATVFLGLFGVLAVGASYLFRGLQPTQSSVPTVSSVSSPIITPTSATSLSYPNASSTVPSPTSDAVTATFAQTFTPSTPPTNTAESLTSPSPPDNSRKILCPAGANVREGPGINHVELTTLAKDTTVTITGETADGMIADNQQGKWAEIIYPPDSGLRRWIVIQDQSGTICIDLSSAAISAFTQGSPLR